MRLERISNDQFTIFLTYDDLIERGFTKDSLWHDASNVRTLFSDMMYEASSELGIELEGMLLVQVHLMQAQGMHIIVTQEMEDNEGFDFDFDEYIEMEVTLDESNELIFSFEEFEHIIQVSPYLSSALIIDEEVYYMDNRYYMILSDDALNEQQKENIIAIMSEFAQPSIVSSFYLKEYAKNIYSTQAIKQILDTFY